MAVSASLGTPPCVIDMARPSALAWHATKTVMLASVLPMALFYVVLATLGLQTAILATVGWYYVGVLLRVLRRRPILGTAMLGAGLMTLRAAIGLWTGSAFVYFLQPVAGTVATATSFAVTALAGRPIIERLAHDFVPLPPALAERLRAARFFDHTSLIWALVYTVNAAGTVWLLTNSSLGAFLLLKTLFSPVLTGAAIAVSYLLFHRLMRREGVQLHWGRRPVAA